jgi:hypothetical protein
MNSSAAARGLGVSLGVDRIAAMARLDFEDFLDKEVTRVYLAGRLSEAKHVERTLTGNGIDYTVDIEPLP